jgi:hypothetical protein
MHITRSAIPQRQTRSRDLSWYGHTVLSIITTYESLNQYAKRLSELTARNVANKLPRYTSADITRTWIHVVLICKWINHPLKFSKYASTIPVS